MKHLCMLARRLKSGSSVSLVMFVTLKAASIDGGNLKLRKLHETTGQENENRAK